MPSTLTYPGVYIEEIPSGVRTITGVATSIAAFVGRARRGPTDADPESPVIVNSYGDFEQVFGGLWTESQLGYAVRDFFLNGGSQAVIVRLYHNDPAPAAPAIPVPSRTPLTLGNLTLEAANPGAWGSNLRFALDAQISSQVAAAMGLAPTALFNLTVREVGPNGATVRSEQFRNVSLKSGAPRRLDKVLSEESSLVRWKGDYPAAATSDAWTDISVLHTKSSELDAALAAVPPVAATILAKQQALALVSTDNITAKEAELLAAQSNLAAAQSATPPNPVAVATAQTAVDTITTALVAAKKTSDGGELTQTEDFTPAGAQAAKRGLYKLEDADLFNLLCLPPYTSTGDVDPGLVGEAAAYCERRRAMLLVDPPSTWIGVAKAKSGLPAVGTNSKNAALFFPRLRQPNPLRNNLTETFAPCGAVAGIFARTDTARGVWKAPAGLDATLVGVPELSVLLTDAENGELNPLAINCLRTRPAAGRVVWGSRTLQGDDRLASEWKYIPVRRLALYIEESLYRGTHWVVFEPNDEPLWAQIRLNVGAFMHGLFRQGAFQGQTPKDAYFVKCDKETTPQDQINLGIVNIVVGFAPLKPAEFVVLKLQQMAGQIDS